MTPYLDLAAVPEPNLAYRHYETRDGIIAVCHPLDEKADALLVEAVGATDATVAAIEERCILMSSAEQSSTSWSKDRVESATSAKCRFIIGDRRT